jgi:hypothetical protein
MSHIDIDPSKVQFMRPSARKPMALNFCTVPPFACPCAFQPAANRHGNAGTGFVRPLLQLVAITFYCTGSSRQLNN